MRTIALVNAKGGVGKSSLTASLGVAAMEAGEKVFLIDMDAQQSLFRWGERREAAEPAVDGGQAVVAGTIQNKGRRKRRGRADDDQGTR
jgi:chromosome partitioning protein